MKDTVMIKSYQNGITLMLSPDCSFEELLKEIALKFTEAKGFFGNARMALSMEGRPLSDDEQLRIVDTIKSCSRLNIVCVVGRDERTEQLFVKAVERVGRHLSQEESAGRFYRGTLSDGQTIETDSSIIVLGDVLPGCAVISAKDIIVIGSLYGSAYAGAGGEEGHFVAALEMLPEKLKIGDFKYESGRTVKWGRKPKMQPQAAYIEQGRLMFKPLTKELLSAF